MKFALLIFQLVKFLKRMKIAIVNAAQLCRATIENCRVRMVNVLINFGRQLFIIVAMAVEAGLEM